MSQPQRVFITGMGLVTPLGIGKENFWTSLHDSCSGIRRIDRFDTSALKSQIAGQIDNFDPQNYMDAKSARRLDRFSAFTIAAAQLALNDAKLRIDSAEAHRAGSYVGSALGGVGNAEAEHARFVTDGSRSVDRLIALSVFAGAGALNLSIHFGLRGPAMSNANSCASGAMAIGEAYRQIRSGYVDVMLAGGAEAPLYPLCFSAFDFIGALSRRNADPEHASRPFDRDRDGFVMAEGAAIFVLESEANARRRGALIYGEIIGYAVTSDAHHMTVPRADGSESARAIVEALADARLSPAQLDYINAHGSATQLNDKTETLAVQKALGDSARRVPISSTKSMHGHALGASGAIEIAACLLAMRHQIIPATANLQTIDPDCLLAHVPATSRPASLRNVLSQSFGFGGTNAALVLSKS